MKKIAFPLTLLSLLFSINSQAESANNFEYKFSGSITSLMLLDSDIAGAGVNIPANSMLGKSSQSDSKFDASLSQIRFQAKQQLDNGRYIDGKVVMDFNANNNSGMAPRLREAYLSWHLGYGTLTTGQTWSTFMDLKNIPASIAEPTLSGAVFKRQPLIRWSQSFDKFSYQFALESHTNSDIKINFEDDDDISYDNISSTPNVVLAVEWNDAQIGSLRASSLISQSDVVIDNKDINKTAYGIHLTGGLNLWDTDKLSVLYFSGRGTNRYLLGLHDTGPSWDKERQALDFRDTHSLIVAYTRQWRNDLKSIFSYSAVQSETLDWQEERKIDAFTNTEYGMANLLWAVESNITVGVEYNYARYKRSNSEEEERDNHRLMLGVDWQF